jgi:RNA polymerase sigma-70 factor (sigma-E family)
VRRSGKEPFEEFVALRSSALQRTAYLLVGDASLAEDLVREALTRTYLAWPRLRDPRDAEAFARRVFTTSAIGPRGHRRDPPARAVEAATVPHAADVPETPGRVGEVDDRTWLWVCLLRLPVRQRAAIVLRFYEDLTERETAEAMGCGIGTVRSEVAAGLAELRPLVRRDLLPLEGRR